MIEMIVGLGYLYFCFFLVKISLQLNRINKRIDLLELTVYEKDTFEDV